MADIIVAGNTSGAITISAPLVAGSGTLTLPTGTDTLVGKATTDTLTNKSIAATQLTGTIAAAALPAGCVLQVVNGTTSTQVTNSTTTYADTGLTATITPSSTSSKILVLTSMCGVEKSAGNLANAFTFQLLRGATIVKEYATVVCYTGTAIQNIGACAYSQLDSPASISAQVYKVQFKNYVAAAQILIQANSSTSSIVLMEIAG